MAITCVPRGHCSTDSPGWYKGKLPGVSEGTATGHGCFSRSVNTTDALMCCVPDLTTNIQVRNCGKFYVWKLPAVKSCSLRYCGSGKPKPLP